MLFTYMHTHTHDWYAGDCISASLRKEGRDCKNRRTKRQNHRRLQAREYPAISCILIFRKPDPKTPYIAYVCLRMHAETYTYVKTQVTKYAFRNCTSLARVPTKLCRCLWTEYQSCCTISISYSVRLQTSHWGVVEYKTVYKWHSPACVRMHKHIWTVYLLRRGLGIRHTIFWHFGMQYWS